VRLRVALDLLEPLAAGSTKVRLVKRRSGSRFVIDNVQVGARGKAKVSGRGNRTGVQILVWEVLTGQQAGERLLPLGVFVDDAEPEVAHVVNSAVIGDKDYPDARAFFKALVMASAGHVATHREVAKRVAALPSSPPPANKKRSVVPVALIESVIPPKPKSAGAASIPPKSAGAASIPPKSAGAASKIPPKSSPSRRPIDPGAALDAVVGEELSRLAPDGWDAWQLAPAPASDPVEPAKPSRPPPKTKTEGGPRGPKRPAVPPPPLPSGTRPDVVLVEPDAVTAAHLEGALRRAGYAVEVCRDADAAVSYACAMQPRCVVYDDEFLEPAGPSVAIRARTNSPRACLSPFIYLTSRRRQETPLARVGARDVWVEKPFSTDELIAKVTAFAGPPAPRDSTKSSVLPPATEVMHGNLAHLPMSELLGMLEADQRSGTLEVESEGRLAILTFRKGRVGRARVSGRQLRASEAVQTLTSWHRGEFTFTAAGTPGAGHGWASPEMAQRSGH